MTQATQTSEPSTPPAGDGRFVLAAGVLLVLIIAMLAFLWLRERKTRMGLENDLARVRKETAQNLDVMQALQGLTGQPGRTPHAGGIEAFSWLTDREGDAVKAVVDGQPCMAVRITREAGERLGFRPGDVVCVAAASAATRPAASAPAAP